MNKLERVIKRIVSDMLTVEQAASKHLGGLNVEERRYVLIGVLNNAILWGYSDEVYHLIEIGHFRDAEVIPFAMSAVAAGYPHMVPVIIERFCKQKKPARSVLKFAVRNYLNALRGDLWTTVITQPLQDILKCVELMEMKVVKKSSGKDSNEATNLLSDLHNFLQNQRLLRKFPQIKEEVKVMASSFLSDDDWTEIEKWSLGD